MDAETQAKVELLRRAIAENPGYVDLYRELGELHFAADMFEEAVAAWRAGYDVYGNVYVDERAESAFIWEHIQAMEARGDMERAIAAFQSALAEGGTVPYHDLFLHFFFLLGKYATACIPRARLEEERARALRDIDGGACRTRGYYTLGVCHASAGELDAALGAFERCRAAAMDYEENELRIDAVLAFAGAVADYERRVRAGDPSPEWTAPSVRELRQAPRRTPLERFADLGVGEAEAKEWLRGGLDTKGARPWLEAGFSAADAAELNARGLRPATHRWWLAPSALDGAVAVLFWGVVFGEPGRVPWDGEPWEARLERLAISVKRSPDEAGDCTVGALATPKGPVSYVAIGASLVRTDGLVPLAVEGLEVEPEWERRVEAFCEIMGVESPAPRWWIGIRA